jgi:hypothetical protein
MKTNKALRDSLCKWITVVLLLGAGRVPAQVTQILYSTPTSPTRDNYTGVIGCQFKVGASNVVVSHLGYFDLNNDGLAISHNVALFNSNLATPSIVGQVVVPSGTAAYLTNGFRWVALDPPLLLRSNTTYILGGLAASGDGDTWQNTFAPTWNTYFIGSAMSSSGHSVYGPGNSTWPPTGFSEYQTNSTYGNVSLGYIEIGPARVGVERTNVSLSAGETLSVSGFATGQRPISYQWYKAPNTLLSGQTNSSLVILHATPTDNGDYYLTATNALGGEQSASVAVLVTSSPVGIAQQPTNLTVFANYPASFSVNATGSPPVLYQWFRNGAIIPGATNNIYSIAAASLTNNGDLYFCVVSNFTGGAGYTATSDDATLTVKPNLALPQQILHGYNTNLSQNSFSGMVGGRFTVGNSPVLVTHLGYYAPTNQYTDATDCNLTQSHRVGIFDASGATLLGYTTVPAGVSPVVNGYIWAPLDPPLVLSNNTQYLLATEVFSGVDPWGNTYTIPDLNPYFATTCAATYWGAAWPGGGTAGGYGGQMYAAPNMAILALSTPSAFVSPLVVTQYVGFDAALTATVAGQAPVTVQWYKEPGTPLNGQTNQILNLNNLALGDSGNYYVIATNAATGAFAQSSDAAVDVLPDTGPSVTQDVQSQDVFIYQNVQFTAAAEGTPVLNYQWKFNNIPLPGATNSTLTLNNVTAANVGTYQLFITNNYGSATSSVASLMVETVPAGTYAGAAMGPGLLAYYRFSEVNSGFGIATNQGVLGFTYNGTYERGYSSVPGPTGFSNFEPDNQAVLLDGFSGDVLVPSFGNVTVSNFTLAAWVYDNGGQPNDSAIFYHRSTSVFGLSIGNTSDGAEWLKYTWNGRFYNNYTGLILPTNQWAFVAMVVNPTNATIYLQDGTSMNSTNFPGTYPAATLSGDSYVGWDTAGGATGRRWTGAIDEVMLFNQALSPADINALYAGLPAQVMVNLARSGNRLVLTWPRGTLLEATNIIGPWVTNNAASPYTNSPSDEVKFYKIQVQ